MSLVVLPAIALVRVAATTDYARPVCEGWLTDAIEDRDSSMCDTSTGSLVARLVCYSYENESCS